MNKREMAAIAAAPGRRGAGALAPAAAPDVAQVLRLQRSVGNAAVSRLLSSRAPADIQTLGRDPAEAPPAEAGAPGDASPIAGLATRVGSAAGLRAALAVNPALADQIVAYFAAGSTDEALNGMMAQAYAGVPATASTDESSEPDEIAEKNPKDPSVPLPAKRPGDKKLAKGQMKWSLDPVDHSSARLDADFKPDATKVDAKNVSFGQTVLTQVGAIRAYAGGTTTDPGKMKAKYAPLEEAVTKKRIDHALSSENDPFYGAEWDQANKKWKREGSSVAVGSSKKGGASTSATMNDTPSMPPARTGLGDASFEFESVAMVLETREPLGALKWGFQMKDAENAPLVLTGAEDGDCTDAPSASWGATMDKFYEGKFETILDSFDGGKSDLKADHKAELDSIVTKMKATAPLKAQLGGAVDFGGDAKADAAALSLKRAEVARDYLVGKGIDAARLEIQSYGSDWARVETAAGKDEPKNRRVQIWLR